MVAAYKTMPHVDMEETKTKALRMLLSSLQQPSLRPAVLLTPVPAILSGDTVLSSEGLGRAKLDLDPEVESFYGQQVYISFEQAEEVERE